MTPYEIRQRRIELGLTVDELAFALGVGPLDMQMIEEGISELHQTAEFKAAFVRLEEIVFMTTVGVPAFT